MKEFTYDPSTGWHQNYLNLTSVRLGPESEPASDPQDELIVYIEGNTYVLTFEGAQGALCNMKHLTPVEKIGLVATMKELEERAEKDKNIWRNKKEACDRLFGRFSTDFSDQLTAIKASDIQVEPSLMGGVTLKVFFSKGERHTEIQYLTDGRWAIQDGSYADWDKNDLILNLYQVFFA